MTIPLIPDAKKVNPFLPEDANTTLRSDTKSDEELLDEVLQRQEDVENEDEEIGKLRRIQNNGTRPLTGKEKQKLYEAGLKAVGIKKQEAKAVMDEMLQKGFFVKTYRLSSTITVGLRTRTYYDVQRTLRFAETESPRIPLHVNDLMFRYNLAASLHSFGSTNFVFPPNRDVEDREKAFDKRLDFIFDLPIPVVTRLNKMLVDFDDKMNAVLSEGAVEDF
jgi:hypothetical protein